MARRHPEKDIRQVLEDFGLGLISGENLLRGRVVDRDGVPARAVFIQSTGGGAALEYQDASGVSMRLPSVNVRVRSDPGKYDDGKCLADDVLNALHLRPPDGYTEVSADQSEPIYIEQDDSSRHHWSINLALIYDEDKDA
jgi:hypothetical protein